MIDNDAISGGSLIVYYEPVGEKHAQRDRQLSRRIEMLPN